MEKQDLKNLKKRYLIWFYKTTKDALDKIERKFTQLEIDESILETLRKEDRANKVKSFIDEFEEYIKKKRQDGLRLKYEGKELKTDYLFLALRLKAIEKTIVKELGRAVLKEIKDSYEQEMIKRIFSERLDKI